MTEAQLGEVRQGEAPDGLGDMAEGIRARVTEARGIGHGAHTRRVEDEDADLFEVHHESPGRRRRPGATAHGP